MKNKYLLFIYLLTLGFTACKKEAMDYPKTIIGKWILKIKTRQEFDANGVKTLDVTQIDSTKNYLQFNTDGTVKLFEGTLGGWGNGPDTIFYNSHYLVTGDKLKILNPLTEEVYVIEKLNKTELVLNQTLNKTDPKRKVFTVNTYHR